MGSESILFSEFLSHPDKLFTTHIANMISCESDEICKQIKLFHDIAKLKNDFQKYIRGESENGLYKNHSLLSAYFFLLNSVASELETAFGFLSIVSHHGDVENFNELISSNKNFGRYFELSNELKFWDEVAKNAKNLEIYSEIKTDKTKLLERAKELYMHTLRLKNKFDYNNFIEFKRLYSSLIYADKFEAIFSEKQSGLAPIKTQEFDLYMSQLESAKPNKKRSEFREFVMSNFDINHKLFTLTAPTGYGKTLTALNFALKFNKERIIYALPFTSITDQTHDVISKIYKDNDDVLVHKAHHKTAIDENTPEDRYSKIKFLMESFSANINVTTLYQLIFAIFGNKNRDNVKFNQLKNSVVIIDEAQAIPYKFRADFIKLCEIISEKFDTVFIFMSATMPIMHSENFREISNLKYFKNQNRYVLKWLDIEQNEENLIEQISQSASEKNTLVVVNTIRKAQELFLRFRDGFCCFCLNGYMHDKHKQDTIKSVKEAINLNKTAGEKPVLLISTQSIEAGVDLDFDVGFREISPISSIVQTAGRINRNFGTQGTLYVFEDICGYSDPIYGDVKLISDNILQKTLLQKCIEEEEILEIINQFFSDISTHLEGYLLHKEMKELAFFDINKAIDEVMNDEYKVLVVIEPKTSFIKEFESEILAIRQNENMDKFKAKDMLKNTIKKISKFGVNVSIKDSQNLILKPILGLKDVYYLPFGDTMYNESFGLKKDVNFGALNEAFS